MKTCSRCTETKPLENFRNSSKSKDGCQPYCVDCVREYDRNRYMTTDRPEKAKLSNKKARERNIAWLENFFEGQKCVDCGNNDRRVFHLDHLDPANKLENVSKLVWKGGSIAKLENEVSKCVVRCANCHMIRTGIQYGWRTVI